MPMEIDSGTAIGTESSGAIDTEASKDYLIEIPMELDLGSLIEPRKNHMITCPVCFEISIISKNTKLYDNLIAACMNRNLKK